MPVGVFRALVTAATVDMKTGLLTCHAWHARAAALLSVTERPIALYVLDVDRFGEVNKAIGHVDADAALARAAHALRRAMGADAVVGRFGGDEFVAITPVDGAEAARRAGQDACDRVAEPVPGRPPAPAGLTVTASIGGVVTRSSTPDLTALLWAADAALYSAKRAGGNTVRIVEAELARDTELEPTERGSSGDQIA
ncbi:GGDEF domain-containing protein [Pseudonocardia hydrocarbonoxydans]|uniref:GGDEF domain-containing protein n=1 Tax=Pseudonocardia hydrocarbonoxydans TaxID=76726 RepID=UPI0031DAC344